MKDYEKKNIEIPFGAFDSELGGWEYTIPEGYEAEIKDGKVIVRKAESNDEKIRKELLEHIKYCSESIPERAAYIAWLEKQGEQKPTDKKHKFNADDWVINDRGNIVRIDKVDYNTHIGIGYCCTDLDGDSSIIMSPDYVDNHYHLWTIQEAKAGDVLVDIYDNILIYQEPSTSTYYHSYCYYHLPSGSFIAGEGSHKIVGTKPATKEQRDQLEKAMADTGYNFDFEKKELRKIEQKSSLLTKEKALKNSPFVEQNLAWSEEDERHLVNTISLIDDVNRWAAADGKHSFCMARCKEVLVRGISRILTLLGVLLVNR